MNTLAPPSQVPPIEDAKRQYVELFGSALVMNTYLKIALLAVSLVALGLLGLNYRTQLRYEHLKPLVIRIDDVGRAEAVRYDSLTYQPRGQAPELKYFLMQFVAKHFARVRNTVKEQYAESLYFLDQPLAEAAIDADRRDQAIDAFVAGTGDETDIQIKNVTLDALATPPYKATVDFEKVYYGAGNRQERGRDRFVAQLTFVLRDQIPNAMVPINPLGLTVTYVRIDQAFQ
jgi:type IV secretory pathway TrbF-like protein